MARGFAKLLRLFAPYAELLPGRDGASYKTGTLPGVRTMAGYENTSRHGSVHFVFSIRSNKSVMRFRLLRAIKSDL